jgi:hypothetical protein
MERALKTQITKLIAIKHPLRTSRYHGGNFTAYELALSMRPDSYLSHGTAAFLHGVTTKRPDFIYANQEQSANEQTGSLTQAGLNNDFDTLIWPTNDHFIWPTPH